MVCILVDLPLIYYLPAELCIINHMHDYRCAVCVIVEHVDLHVYCTCRGVQPTRDKSRRVS